MLWRISLCESGGGLNPAAYDLDATNGGIAQLNKSVWQPFFARTEGWSWADIVLDDATNLRAALVIYERSSGFTPWSCWKP